MPPSVLWLRRDLRLHDNPAVVAALAAGGTVAPLFVLDGRLLDGRFASANRNWFLVESLRVLADELRARGGQLFVREGPPESAVPAFAAEVGALEVHASRDYTPFARRRDAALANSLEVDRRTLHLHRGTLAQEPETMVQKAGAPYRVFTPFLRKWEEAAVRPMLAAPPQIPAPEGIEVGHLPAPGRFVPTATERIEPGELAARARLTAWAEQGIAQYAALRDLPGAAGSSRLSQDLRFGLLSPAEVLEHCSGDGPGPRKLRAEIAWRDFYAHLLWHFPRLAREPMQDRYRAVPWRSDPAGLEAWDRGRTGYPFVDAAMHELAATGFMHNRSRMAAASFLTKDLLIHWREGERHFMRHLFDGDPASNNGGWQWAASTGADAQPYFRVFNPTRQGETFDADGAYVRRWLPALARVPIARLHRPWTMSANEQADAACRIGVDYPAPIVDHATARLRAIAAFRTTGPLAVS